MGSQLSQITEADKTTARLELDVEQQDRKVKLVVRHPEIGLVCELWCYEGGPFQRGTGVRREDGSVVITHTSGGMNSITTFTSLPGGRIAMDIEVDGPVEALRRVNMMGPCMQYWHSDAFKRRGSLIEFASRCFIYTLRGPVPMLQTARGPQKGFDAGGPENNPPCTQWYVPVGRAHPGDIWAFGASGDRPLHELVGVASHDGKWLAAIGCEYNLTLGQGWHDCIHHVPWIPKYLDEAAGRIRHRGMIYVMRNDPAKLLDAFRADFPGGNGRRAVALSTGKKGALIAQAHGENAPRLEISLSGIGDSSAAWQRSTWGAWTRSGKGWRMWAAPARGNIEFCVSRTGMEKDATARAKLTGAGWRPVESHGTGAQVLQSDDGRWTAALLWERAADDDPATAELVTGAVNENLASARGRLFLYEGKPDQLADRMLVEGYQGNDLKPRQDWKNAAPYRMPVEDNDRHPSQDLIVGFGPNEKDQALAYALTLVPPWKDGGVLHVNFPEHFEHGDVGYSILRHHDKLKNPWTLSPGSHSASYGVESPHLPGVKVHATATADGDRAHLTLKITNGGEKTLHRVKPLLCFHYDRLAGFPQRLTNNFEHIYVVVDGKPVRLADIATKNPDANAKVAYVRGCGQHDCNKFANSRGGLIDKDIDIALIAIAAVDGRRKVVITFTPGKSILSNAFIPCAHADPFFGDLKPGESIEVKGEVLFTEDDLESVVKNLLKRGVGKAKGP